jgi:hypothetical protein
MQRVCMIMYSLGLAPLKVSAPCLLYYRDLDLDVVIQCPQYPDERDELYILPRCSDTV